MLLFFVWNVFFLNILLESLHVFRVPLHVICTPIVHYDIIYVVVFSYIGVLHQFKALSSHYIYQMAILLTK